MQAFLHALFTPSWLSEKQSEKLRRSLSFLPFRGSELPRLSISVDTGMIRRSMQKLFEALQVN